MQTVTESELIPHLAQEMAHIAAARSAKYPMDSILNDRDRWALAYQAKLAELRGLLSPGGNAQMSLDGQSE